MKNFRFQIFIYVKRILLICFAFLHVNGWTQDVLDVSANDSCVYLKTSEGLLMVCPLADNAVRIRMKQDIQLRLPELIFTERTTPIGFELAELPTKVEIRTQHMIVTIEKQGSRISFSDTGGDVFLQEEANGRRILPSVASGAACLEVEQSFQSPENELILGLGQFQDGHFNLRGIPRKLIQVNSQIAIPFIYSDRGYGLLWHQYGLTDFNPADSLVSLTQVEHLTDDSSSTARVTTTEGTRVLSQDQTMYTGTFSVPHDGEYALFLDLETMGNRHYLAVDGKVYIDQQNIWLPPAVGCRLELPAGEHKVEVICKKDNQPQLAWKTEDGLTTFRSPHADAIDYVVFYGPSADSIIRTYRQLSGDAPMLPKWSFGYWQCRERYSTSEELITAVREFRKRELPMDVIVQDWQYWGSKGWGVPQFDETNYPDPEGFIGELHNMNARFNISIWSNPDKNSELGKAFAADDRFITGTKWLDYFDPATRDAYWHTLKTNMFDYGVDSWWMDAVEPENDALHGEMTHIGPGDFYRLTYPLMVSRAVYEGQRETTDAKRVCILTRSAFAGQQRYGVINWSGDIGGTWDAFRRQITAGLNYSITGMPYWTTDIGGFFRPGEAQYTDPEYHELLLRWFQWGVFNPIFRMHGYQSETEPWKYGAVVENHMRNMLKIRYRLLPYIYSEAWKISHSGSTLMRPLVMDFRTDSLSSQQAYEYMFGKSLLVAPVTESGVEKMNVWLPSEADWYDFWTGRYYHGGQNIEAASPPGIIPVFVRSGTILPLGPDIQYTGEKPADTLEIRIYAGTDARFELYEDEGDNYNYEEGAYSLIPIAWNEADQELIIGEQKGTFRGIPELRHFRILLIDHENPAGIGSGESTKEVDYTRSSLVVKFREKN